MSFSMPPLRWLSLALLGVALTGCASAPEWMPSAGPSRDVIEQAAAPDTGAIRLVEIDAAATQRAQAAERQHSFAESFVAGAAFSYVVGLGDSLEVTVWEAPPATLFGGSVAEGRAGVATTRAVTLTEQMVSASGHINVPFAGMVPVAGQALQQIESEIARRLVGLANRPQVVVRVVRNASANVTVVGEVAQSVRMPLTARGERLLDAIAAAGGVRQPVNRVTVQLTRRSQVRTMPLERVVRSPADNIALAPDDVLTVFFQPFGVTVLGAAGRNDEINFEATGISLAQVLGRAGGVQDARADARGVFLFRFEAPEALAPELRAGPVAPDGRVPVVYRLDLSNPAAFLVAQNFPVRDRDVIFVANAPAAELQKFLGILTASVFSVSSLVNLGN